MVSCTSVDAALASGRALRARFVLIQFTPGTVSVFTPSCELAPFASWPAYHLTFLIIRLVTEWSTSSPNLLSASHSTTRLAAVDHHQATEKRSATILVQVTSIWCRERGSELSILGRWCCNSLCSRGTAYSLHLSQRRIRGTTLLMSHEKSRPG